jgi:hypothetical protein
MFPFFFAGAMSVVFLSAFAHPEPHDLRFGVIGAQVVLPEGITPEHAVGPEGAAAPELAGAHDSSTSTARVSRNARQVGRLFKAMRVRVENPCDEVHHVAAGVLRMSGGVAHPLRLLLSPGPTFSGWRPNVSHASAMAIRVGHKWAAPDMETGHGLL